ncbi:PASTA domain-containing protein [Prevotella sp. OH937_COT-195]|uniref:PASTA domain-containing protein n=1 Tax=Prevotella sp. OH937_COT-195 TaxID=2491051 RepID=UPI000F64DE8D|nr:PASTA domain-containing protein [Prevotella sp. OH937_COT-195]RRD00815.1 PASTA domain-containing protein [Prevotella sp. OH937_COT-195]
MEASTFFKKIFSRYIWGNLFAMIAVVALIAIGARYGLDLYTHHGEKITIPDVRHKSFADAEHILENAGLQVMVSDSGYIKSLPPDCILEQTPAPGKIVKSGHVVYLVVNSDTPRLSLPDIIDNSSYRAAKAKLISMGFKVGDPMFVHGERDWVYGVKCKGKNLTNGQKVSVDDILIIQVGDGMRGDSDDILVDDSYYEYNDDHYNKDSSYINNGEINHGNAQPVSSGGTDEFREISIPDEL